MYLNASQTAATRLHFFPLFFLQNQLKILGFPLSFSEYVGLWLAQPSPLPVTGCLVQSLAHSWGAAGHAEVMPSPA